MKKKDKKLIHRVSHQGAVMAVLSELVSRLDEGDESFKKINVEAFICKAINASYATNLKTLTKEFEVASSKDMFGLRGSAAVAAKTAKEMNIRNAKRLKLHPEFAGQLIGVGI